MISAKECIALQKALDSTLFSGFEGAIRHLWSVIWPDCQRPTVMQLHRKSGKKFTLLRVLFRSEWWGNYQQNKISKINFPFFEYILEQTSSEKLWIVYYSKIYSDLVYVMELQVNDFFKVNHSIQIHAILAYISSHFRSKHVTQNSTQSLPIY